mgnify:CR=1 FL=1
MQIKGIYSGEALELLKIYLDAKGEGDQARRSSELQQQGTVR